MIKVCFDYKVFFEQSLGGASKYIFQLNKELIKFNCNSKILSPVHINNYIYNNKSIKTFYKFKNQYPKFTRNFFERFNRIYTNYYLKTNKVDIFHFTLENIDYLKIFPGKKVTTVYDLIHEKFDKYYNLPVDYKIKKKFFLNQMDHIICISENTKKDLIQYYDISENKISVTHLATSYEVDNRKVSNFDKTTKPYVLFVGYRKRYKNFINFIKAFSVSDKLKSDFDIICFGNQEFDRNEISIIDSLNLNKSIKLVSGDDEKLEQFYKNASLFVFPSLYEGFGIPLLEAMKNKCPISCSNTSSLKEIGSDAVDYFDPNSVDSISSSMENVLYSENYKNDLINKGLKNILKFSWKKCAINTLEIYNKIN